MGSPSPRSPGPVTRPVTPTCSTRTWRGWRRKTSKTAICELMRIAWRTVGAIITRVWDDTTKVHDQFAGLTRIGIDEISYKRGHKYLTCLLYTSDAADDLLCVDLGGR